MKNVCRNYKYTLNQTTDSEVTMSHKRLKARYWHTWKKISGHAKFWFQKTAKKLLNKYKDTILTGRGTASPCELYQLFEGTCCPYRQGFKVHDLLTQHHIPKLLKSLIKWLWKPPNSQQNIYTWICMGEAEFYVRVCIHFLYSFDIKSSKVHHQWCKTSPLRETIL